VLASALLVVVLVAALIAGVFFATMEETQIVHAGGTRDLALTAAEAAIEQTIGSWSGASDQAIGVNSAKFSTFSQAGVSVDITVTRLDSTLYSIVARARSPSSINEATRRIGVVVSAQKAVDHSTLIDPITERWWSELL
jgi:hypothetical protein